MNEYRANSFASIFLLKEEIIKTSKELIEYVKNKNDIKDIDEFNCPIYRKIATLFEMLEEEKNNG